MKAVRFDLRVRSEIPPELTRAREFLGMGGGRFFTVPQAAGMAFGRPFQVADIREFTAMGGRVILANAELADSVVRGFAEALPKYIESVVDIRNVKDIPHFTIKEFPDYEGIHTEFRPFLPEFCLIPYTDKACQYLTRLPWHKHEDIYSMSS